MVHAHKMVLAFQMAVLEELHKTLEAFQMEELLVPVTYPLGGHLEELGEEQKETLLLMAPLVVNFSSNQAKDFETRSLEFLSC